MEDFMWLVKNADLKQLKKIVEEGNLDVNKEQLGGRKALHFAADYGHDDIIKYLLSKGADINEEDKFGITPLLCAIFEGHIDTVKLLLSNGASKDGRAPDGQTYIACADTAEMKKALS
ncbi:myotrophin-like [Lineus longissimus]|uniref:myotrophin-like n=1 Tax=Lineus longissimus TaxID=88925 RepID=UPI00315DC1A4